MALHSFTLIVEGADLRSGPVVDALFEAGCDDATVGSVDDTHYVDFDRDAPSLAKAIVSAIEAVEQVEGARVTQIVDADPVPTEDIAKLTGRIHESVRLLITGARGTGGFPRDSRDSLRAFAGPASTEPRSS